VVWFVFFGFLRFLFVFCGVVDCFLGFLRLFSF